MPYNFFTINYLREECFLFLIEHNCIEKMIENEEFKQAFTIRIANIQAALKPYVQSGQFKILEVLPTNWVCYGEIQNNLRTLLCDLDGLTKFPFLRDTDVEEELKLLIGQFVTPFI